MSDEVNSYEVSATELKEYIERLERLDEEKTDLGQMTRDVFAEAKGRGFDTKVMKRILSERKRDASEVESEQAIYDLYKDVLA